jgi:aspartyl-tRNA(Asn)/glutamyl-tRNA(Gln) amidotransferase subunit B
MSWDPVIGIEVHVELRTQSKMFCSCAVSFGEDPNTNTCPTCLGLPGALPVINRSAIEWLVQIGLALGCEIAPHSVFHRKSYFYADLPKNYQISQYDLPLCREGWLDISVDGRMIRVGIERAHMEEDTGKSLHTGAGGRIHSAGLTLLDFNRSGVPLVEIVSKPDMHSAAEARAYAQELRNIVAELGVSDARMEEGSIRFDANVSVRPSAYSPLGTKVEIKNMNSFRSLERAVDYEIDRQIKEMEAGGVLVQETRHWDEEAGITHSMRTKEGSSDYRYFADPDLSSITLDESWIDPIRARLPELPASRRRRVAALGIEGQVLAALTSADPELRGLFDQTVAIGADPVITANWVTGEITALFRRQGHLLSARDLGELIGMIADGVISVSAAKDVLVRVMAGEGSPSAVVQAHDLGQTSDESAIGPVVDEVLAANAEALERYRRGEEKVLSFLVGRVMQATKGKADPKLVNQILRQRLQ